MALTFIPFEFQFSTVSVMGHNFKYPTIILNIHNLNIQHSTPTLTVKASQGQIFESNAMVSCPIFLPCVT